MPSGALEKIYELLPAKEKEKTPKCGEKLKGFRGPPPAPSSIGEDKDHHHYTYNAICCVYNILAAKDKDKEEKKSAFSFLRKIVSGNSHQDYINQYRAFLREKKDGPSSPSPSKKEKKEIAWVPKIKNETTLQLVKALLEYERESGEKENSQEHYALEELDEYAQGQIKLWAQSLEDKLAGAASVCDMLLHAEDCRKKCSALEKEFTAFSGKAQDEAESSLTTDSKAADLTAAPQTEKAFEPFKEAHTQLCEAALQKAIVATQRAWEEAKNSFLAQITIGFVLEEEGPSLRKKYEILEKKHLRTSEFLATLETNINEIFKPFLCVHLNHRGMIEQQLEKENTVQPYKEAVKQAALEKKAEIEKKLDKIFLSLSRKLEEEMKVEFAQLISDFKKAKEQFSAIKDGNELKLPEKIAALARLRQDHQAGPTQISKTLHDREQKCTTGLDKKLFNKSKQHYAETALAFEQLLLDAQMEIIRWEAENQSKLIEFEKELSGAFKTLESAEEKFKKIEAEEKEKQRKEKAEWELRAYHQFSGFITAKEKELEIKPKPKETVASYTRRIKKISKKISNLKDSCDRAVLRLGSDQLVLEHIAGWATNLVAETKVDVARGVAFFAREKAKKPSIYQTIKGISELEESNEYEEFYAFFDNTKTNEKTQESYFSKASIFLRKIYDVIEKNKKRESAEKENKEKYKNSLLLWENQIGLTLVNLQGKALEQSEKTIQESQKRIETARSEENSTQQKIYEQRGLGHLLPSTDRKKVLKEQAIFIRSLEAEKLLSACAQPIESVDQTLRENPVEFKKLIGTDTTTFTELKKEAQARKIDLEKRAGLFRDTLKKINQLEKERLMPLEKTLAEATRILPLAEMSDSARKKIEGLQRALEIHKKQVEGFRAEAILAISNLEAVGQADLAACQARLAKLENEAKEIFVRATEDEKARSDYKKGTRNSYAKDRAHHYGADLKKINDIYADIQPHEKDETLDNSINLTQTLFHCKKCQEQLPKKIDSWKTDPVLYLDLVNRGQSGFTPEEIKELLNADFRYTKLKDIRFGKAYSVTSGSACPILDTLWFSSSYSVDKCDFDLELKNPSFHQTTINNCNFFRPITRATFIESKISACHFASTLEKADFSGAIIDEYCKFSSFKGFIFSARTQLDEKHQRQLLKDTLADPYYDFKDGMGTEKNTFDTFFSAFMERQPSEQQVQTVLYILKSINNFKKPNDILDKKHFEAQKVRAQFVQDHVLPKVLAGCNKLEDLAGFCDLIVKQNDQFPYRFLLKDRPLFQSIITKIQDRVTELAKSASQKSLSKEKVGALNTLMNYYRPIGRENTLFARRPYDVAKVFYSNKIPDKKDPIVHLAFAARLYEIQAEQAPNGPGLLSFFNRTGKFYRVQLFREAIKILQDDKNITQERVQQIRRTIAGAKVTHLGARTKWFSNNFQYERPKAQDNSDSLGTTQGGYLMDRILSQLEQLSPEFDGDRKGIAGTISKDYNELRRYYPGLPQWDVEAIKMFNRPKRK